ncbi:hypothetical protein [Streptococcus suis]|uniref:Uncharacterized protein n=1 Tax=Streptococcus suis TaxID=1307 RepID=A0A0Z8IXB2_STRSU|nr:hypothetical protein [Streptococcus suis]MDW8778894.1 hypothetical protein [Streptococcus suis]CYV43443.1 Uncharacterised protein [Streptococcus suis]HEM6156765.1 hypothetical protein [Streptococcus suis]
MLNFGQNFWLLILPTTLVTLAIIVILFVLVKLGLKRIFRFIFFVGIASLVIYFLANVSLFHWTLITIVFTLTVSLFSKEIFQTYYGIDVDKSLFVKMNLTKLKTKLKFLPVILYLSIFFTTPEGYPIGVKQFFGIDVNEIIYVKQSEQDKLTIFINDEEEIQLKTDDKLEIGANEIIISSNGKETTFLSKNAMFDIENQKWFYQLESVFDVGNDKYYSFSPNINAFDYKLATVMIRILIIEIIYLFTILVEFFYSKKIQSLLGLAPELKDFQGEWYQLETYDWYQKNFVYSLPSFVIKGETLIIKDRKIATPISYSGEGIEFEIGDTKYRLQLDDGKLYYNEYIFLHKNSSEYKALRKDVKLKKLERQSDFLLKPVLVACPPFLRTEHIYFVQVDRLIATRTKEACFSNMDVIRKEIILPDYSRVPYSRNSDRFNINGRIYEIIE